MAIKSNNEPCVAYIDSSNNDLMYACNTNSNECSQGWTVETVSNSLNGTTYSSLAFNSLDEPWIKALGGGKGGAQVRGPFDSPELVIIEG